jgi:hypothetical protein
MPSFHFARTLPISADRGWAVLDAYSRAEDAIFAIVDEAHMEGDVRVVSAGGHVVHERLLTVDPANRRVAYTIAEQPPGIDAHFAQMEILPVDDGHCELRWVTDYAPVLPAGAEVRAVYEGAFADLAAAVASGNPRHQRP